MLLCRLAFLSIVLQVVMALPSRVSRATKTERIPEEILEEHEEYNVVKYETSTWVCTKTVKDITEDPLKGWREKFDNTPMAAMGEQKEQGSATSGMFMKLFKYIAGVNDQTTEIKMTAPVTTHRKAVQDDPSKEEIEMCFWTGSPWVGKTLPQPLDKDVYLQERQGMEVFVRRFGGWAISREDWQEHKKALEESISGRDDVDMNGGYYTIGYDSPWKTTDRRNEVWIPKKSEAVVANTIPTESLSAVNGLETVEYTVVSKTDDYEVREYPASKWICTKMESIDTAKDPMNGWEDEFNNDPFAAMDSGKWETQPTSKMFNKLFVYISGANSDKTVIDMTTPVTVLHKLENSEGMEMQEECFWLGSEWQDKTPPKPFFDEVYVQDREAMKVYVRKFSGFALSYDDFHKEYMNLRETIKDDASVEFEPKSDDTFYGVSYDSPFVVKNRRNEVWISTTM